jgi:membrane protein DedA with SNARE-associated domain
MAWTVPACVIWAVTYVTFGTVAAGSYRALAQQLHWAGYLFVGAIVLFVVAVYVVKKLISRHEARHWAAPGDGDANTTED